MTAALHEDQESLRYPIGKYKPASKITEGEIDAWITALEVLPAELQAAVAELNQNQLDTAYRQGGWTVRQVIHHLPDSHLNSYVRFRLALTEESPLIKPYDEAAWAELSDARTAPIKISLSLLEALHGRWTSSVEIAGSGCFRQDTTSP